MEEIRAMGPGAAAQLDALLNLSDLKLSEFADLYKEKQRFANQQALEELKSLREETDVQIQASLNEISNLYGRGAPAVGQSFADGLAKGMLEGSSTAASAAAAVAQGAARRRAAAEERREPVPRVRGRRVPAAARPARRPRQWYRWPRA